MLGNGPQVLGNDNGPLVLCKGPHLLGNMSQFGIMSHSGLCRLALCRSALCRIRPYVAFGLISHSALCRIRPYVAFGVMSFGIMSHSALCSLAMFRSA